MKSVVGVLSALVLGMAVVACQKTAIEWKEYLSWLHNPENNISQSKVVNDIRITVRMLPPEYLAYREIRDNQKLLSKKDSVIAHYKKSLTFTLTIGPDTSAAMDRSIILRKVYNYEQFVERVMTLNFSMSNFITLTADNITLRPVLASLDNIYGLNNSATIVVVFVGEDSESLDRCREYDFEWHDLTYTTGIHHFVFTGADIKAIPTLQF